MAQLAYLGPEYSFSHDLVRQVYGSQNEVPCSSLAEVVECVAEGRADSGVVPFYNTTKRSIEETQVELIRFRNKIFVHDVIPLEVNHFLCGFGTLSEVTELRSKNVVFYQASKWLEKHMPKATRDDTWGSTAQAIESLVGAKAKNIAAIGSKNACDGYGVPVLAKNIQNKPNITSFFVLGRAKPEANNTDHVLMCITDATIDVKKEISELVGKSGCSISSNWPLATERMNAYFFEMNGEYSKLDLQSTVCQINNRFGRQVFVVGGYSGKCITSLMFDS